MADGFNSVTLLLGWKWWKKTVSEKYDFLFDKQGFPRGQTWALIFTGFLLLFLVIANIIGAYNFGTKQWFKNGASDLWLILVIVPILCETIYNFWWAMFWGVSIGHGIAKVLCEENTNRSYFWIAFVGNLITSLITLFLMYLAGSKTKNFSKEFWDIVFLPISFIISQLLGLVGLVWLKKYYQYRINIETPDTSEFSQNQTLDSHLTDGDPDN